MADLLAALSSQALLFLLISGMAGSCDARQLIRKFTSSDAKGIVAGIACQYVALPLMGFFALSTFPQHPVVAISLLIVTTSPGGGFSGLWCSVCNADLALSVAMTTASTIAVCVALPLNVWLYIQAMFPGTTVDIAWSQLLLSVVVVVAGVVFGSATSYVSSIYAPDQAPGLRQGMNTLGSAAGVCLMVFGGASNAASDEPIWTNDADWFACVALPCVLGLLCALVVARTIDLSSPSAVAVAIECCYQNTGLALTIALSAVPPEMVGKASGVPIFYGLVEIALIPAFALVAWRLGWTYAPPDAPLWVALAMNYQPSDEDTHEHTAGYVSHQGEEEGDGGDGGEGAEADVRASVWGGSTLPGVLRRQDSMFPKNRSKIEKRVEERDRVEARVSFAEMSVRAETPPDEHKQFRSPNSVGALLRDETRLQKDLAKMEFASSLARGIHMYADGPNGQRELAVPRLFDDYVNEFVKKKEEHAASKLDSQLTEEEKDRKDQDSALLARLKADRPRELAYVKRDLLNQEALLLSARQQVEARGASAAETRSANEQEAERQAAHKVSYLLIACYEDKGQYYPFNARRAEKARRAQLELIKDMVLSGANLPYMFRDSVDTSVHRQETPNPYERGMWSFLRDTGLLGTDTRMRMLTLSAPRLVNAFASFTRPELEKVVRERFFRDPALTVYQMAKLCHAATVEVDRQNKQEAFHLEKGEKLEALNAQLQQILAELCAFIDCPLDSSEATRSERAELVDPRPLLDIVLCNPRGWLALRTAAECGCTRFLASSKVAPFFTRHRRGSLYQQLMEESRDLEGADFPVHRVVLRQLFVGAVILVNVLFLLPSLAVVLSLRTFFPRRVLTLWKNSQARPVYTKSDRTEGIFSLCFNTGIALKRARYNEAQHLLRTSGDDESKERVARNVHTRAIADTFLLPFLDWLPPALYLLEEPWIEHWLNELGSFAQLLSLSMLRETSGSRLGYVWVNTVWVVAVALSEVQRFSRLGFSYLVEGLNVVQIMGLSLVFVALSYEMLSEGRDERFGRIMMSTGLLMLWLHTLRILFRFASMGPLVHILFELYKDVAKWFVLVTLVVISFGVALFALYYDFGTGDAFPPDKRWPEDCDLDMRVQEKWKQWSDDDADLGFFTTIIKHVPFAEGLAELHDTTSGLFFMMPLAGSALTGDSKLECIRSTKHATEGSLMVLFFLVCAGVVLTNLLIAMMSHRFERNYEQTNDLYLVMKARETIYSKSTMQWQLPPPLNLLFTVQPLFHFLHQLLDGVAAMLMAPRHPARPSTKTFCDDELPYVPDAAVLAQLDLAAVWYEDREVEQQLHMKLQERIERRVRCLGEEMCVRAEKACDGEDAARVEASLAALEAALHELSMADGGGAGSEPKARTALGSPKQPPPPRPTVGGTPKVVGSDASLGA